MNPLLEASALPAFDRRHVLERQLARATERRDRATGRWGKKLGSFDGQLARLRGDLVASRRLLAARLEELGRGTERRQATAWSAALEIGRAHV